MNKWMNEKNVTGKLQIHILCSMTFIHKLCPLWDNVENFGTARQAINDKLRGSRNDAICVLNTWGTHS